VGFGDATPALVGDKLYVHTRQGDEEVISCLSAADGSKVWENRYAAAAVGGPAARHPGPRSSPAVAEGKVVTLGVMGTVSCLDAGTGALVWRKDPFPGAIPPFATASSPLITDGMAVAFLGGQGNGALMAFDLAAGDVKWQWTAEAAEYGSPVVATLAGTPQIVTMSEKSLMGVNVADGTLLWQIPFAPQGRSYNSATPIIDGDTVIYAASMRGTHAVRIEKQGDAFTPVPVWDNADVSPQFSTPVLNGGLLFGLSDRGNLYCLNAQTGALAWADTAQIDRGTFGPMLDLGEVIITLPTSGELIAFSPDGTAYAELARLKLANTPTYAHPVIAGKRIFVKDEGSLTLLTMD
jgi:outer membrane protein assembly factor BamB